jgi:hypothetical protein
MEFRAEKEATIAAASARCRAKGRISIAAQIRWAATMGQQDAKTKLRKRGLYPQLSEVLCQVSTKESQILFGREMR